MKTDAFERNLRSALHETLDRELGPDPVWDVSPAARRVAELDRSRRRWPVRVLGIAALVGAGGAAALLAGVPKQPEAGANGWIAFTVQQAGPAEVGSDLDIWFVALDQEPRRVIGTDSDRIDQLCPAFAPDGGSLAYGRVEGAGDNPDDGAWSAAYRDSAVVIADVADDGTVVDRHTIDVGDGLPPVCPVWSPDGEHLAFGVPRTSPINPKRSGEGSEVWVVRTADRRVSVIPDLLATDLEWSPDGSVLAIVGGVETASGVGVRDGLQDGRIHLYQQSTGTLRTLDDTVGVDSVTWSPDGRRIAMSRPAILSGTFAYAGGDALRVIDLASGRQEVLTDEYRSVHGVGPVWSPDGRTIAYQRVIAGSSEKHEVVLVAPDDRSAETGMANEVVMPTERTTADGSTIELFPWRFTWSPDGAYLLYVAWGTPVSGLVAVPTDLDAPAVVLAEMDAIVAYDGYDDTMRVPSQVWGRDPFPSSSAGVTPFAGESPSPTAPANASSTVDSIGDWLDRSRWTTYASERYQFTIGHPATWTVIESRHTWDQETDSINWDSGALEAFVPPENTISIYLAAWSVQ